MKKITKHQPTGKKLYRYEVSTISNSYVDEFNNYYRREGYRNTITLLTFDVTRETEKSWTIYYMGHRRVISKSTRKKFAYETKELALLGAAAIKRSAVGHAESRLAMQESALNALRSFAIK